MSVGPLASVPLTDITSDQAVTATFAANPIPVYRFYRISGKYKGYHFLTGSAAEINAFTANRKVWRKEGIAFYSNPATNKVQVHRFTNVKNGSYLYTYSPIEIANVRKKLARTWKYETLVFSASGAGTPVWRFRNTKYGYYFYSSNPTELANMATPAMAKTWNKESVVFYIAP